MRLTEEQYKKLLGNSINVKTNKYKNEKVIYNNIKFDSKKERNYYIKLKLLEDKGIISDLKLQVKYELQPSFRINGVAVRPITYIADFVYIQNGEEHIVDTKGIKTDVYKIKKKLFQYKFKKDIEEV